MPNRVCLLTRDLVFRSRLGGVVAAAGGEVTRDAAACELAVIEIESVDWEGQIRILQSHGVPVLAFGAHVNAERLRQARALGAVAVPNSQVEQRLAELLAGQQ